VARRQLEDALEERLGRVIDPVARHQIVNRLGARRARPGEHDRLELGGERQATVRHPVVERLDAEAVARGEEAVLLRVPDREAPHPVHARQHVLAPGRPRGEDHLGVAAGAKRRAPGLQLLAQLDEVVNLAVEDEPVAPARIAHGLVAGGRKVEDRQPAEREAHAARQVGAGASRAGAYGMPESNVSSEVAAPPKRRTTPSCP
jgi:hypothetical protein